MIQAFNGVEITSTRNSRYIGNSEASSSDWNHFEANETPYFNAASYFINPGSTFLQLFPFCSCHVAADDFLLTFKSKSFIIKTEDVLDPKFKNSYRFECLFESLEGVGERVREEVIMICLVVWSVVDSPETLYQFLSGSHINGFNHWCTQLRET